VHILAAVTRYHRGALPRRSRDGLSQMSSQNQITCVQLAGILRLADALESCCQGQPTRVSVEKTSETALVYAAGYNAHSRLAEKVAAARHLLEVSCRAPIGHSRVEQSLTEKLIPSHRCFSSASGGGFSF